MKINMRISRPQYRAMIERMMSRQAPVEQESQALNLQRNLVDMNASLRDLSQASPALSPPEASEPGSVATPQQSMPLNALPTQRPIQDYLSRATQVWQQIGGTIGGMLWARLSKSPNPEQSFLQAAVQFQQDPNSIMDERVKQFLAGVLPVEAPAQAQPMEQAPVQTAGMVPQGSSPLFKTIFDSLR